MGIEKHEEDFGQTFGRWGVGEGAYVVWPIIGPRTLRDTVGLSLMATWILSGTSATCRCAILCAGLRLVNQRAQLLPLDKTVEEAATDKYAYVRDAYLQRRRSLIRDGRPQRDNDEGAGLELPASMAGGQGLRFMGAVPAGEAEASPAVVAQESDEALLGHEADGTETARLASAHR